MAKIITSKTKSSGTPKKVKSATTSGKKPKSAATKAWENFRTRMYKQLKEENDDADLKWIRAEISELWKTDASNPKNATQDKNDEGEESD